MSDIFTEVEEDMRRERMKRLWDRFGIYVILTAVLIVALTAGWRGYEAWSTSRARAAGDEFAAALERADTVASVETGEALEDFAADAPAGYALLARFRAATQFANAGEVDRATAILRDLASDGGVGDVYQDVARIRLGHILLANGEAAAVPDALGALAENTADPFHRSAQELMGLAAYAEGDIGEATRWYRSLADATGTPAELRQRASVMLDLFAQSGAAPNGDGEAEEETN